MYKYRGFGFPPSSTYWEKAAAMSFVTYENYPEPHVTIHRAGCRHIRKGGGTDPSRGKYESHQTYAEADAYARTTGLPVKNCSSCKPEIVNV